MKFKITYAILAALALLAISCGEPEQIKPQPEPDPETPTPPAGEVWSVDGNVQKGPFTQGTNITIQALDEALNPTGKNYSTKTVNDAGSFEIDNKIESRFVEIIAQGYYFNEIEGKVSSSTLTLRSLSDLSEEGKTNVNLLTTLESDRIRVLVKAGKTMAEAREQAEKEIFGVFNIPNAVSADSGFDKMDITKGTDADGILLAISASLQAGRSVGELSELISKIAGAISSTGKVEDELLRSKIIEGCKKVNADAVRSNLTRRYADLGIADFKIPPFEDYLDVNGNGVIDKNDSWIILGGSEFVVSDKGGSFTLKVQHNVDYEVIVNDAPWLSWQIEPSTKSYLEEVTLKFTAEPNPETDARYAVIQIKDKASAHIEQATVMQKQKDAVTVSASSFELEKEGGSFEVELGFNAAEATYGTDVPWLHLLQTKAMQYYTLVFKADPNPEVETRTGHIVFKGGEASETVTVYQKGGRSIIVLSEKEITVGPDAGSQIYIRVSANVDFEVMGPNVPWLTLANDAVTRATVTHEYTYVTEENTTGEPREAEIVFKDKESDLSETVKIIQRQNDVMNGKGEYRIPYEGGTLEIPLETNFDFTPRIEQEGDWLSIISTKAMHTASVTLKAEQNESLSPRSAKLWLEGTYTTYLINIIQRANAQQVTVTVPTPGGLAGAISQEDLHKIVNLKIVGTLNDADLDLLKGGYWDPGSPYAGQEGPHIESDWFTEILDLSEMTTESGGIGVDKQFFGFVPTLYKVIMPLHIETVGTGVFERCENLETVDFGSGSDILTICGSIDKTGGTGFGTVNYYGAFKQCISIKEITLPDNLEDFQAGAFLNCSGLQKVVFPASCNVRALKCSSDGYSTGLSYIDFSMGHFWGCTSLETVELPPSLRRIEAGALTGGQFRKLIIPETVTEIITEHLFEDCSRLEEVTLPSSVTQFDKYMFAGCANLTKINMAATVTKYGEHCFDGANSAMLKLDPSIEYGEGVFAHMDIESLVIPEGFTSIPKEMFLGCNNLRSLDLGNVENIGEQAFLGAAIESLALPPSVKYVAYGAFSQCEALSNLSIQSERIFLDGPFPLCNKLTSLNIGKDIVSITGYISTGENYRNPITSITFEEGSRCEEFGIGAYTGITTISLPTTLKRLTENAFRSTPLKAIELPAGLTYIGERAFAYSELRNVTLPASVDSIDDRAFADCKKLYTFEIPEDSRLRLINNLAFGYCENLDPFVIRGAETMDIYASCLTGTYINDFVLGKNVRVLNFLGSGQIKNFSVEQGSVLEEISNKNKAFSSDATINLPPSIKVVGNGLFRDFAGTVNADFMNLTAIGEETFAGFSGTLNAAGFPNVVSMGNRAFRGFQGTLNANFASLTAIPDFAFELFGGTMQNVNFGNVTSIGEGAFEEFKGSISIDWNNALFGKVESIGRYAFAKGALLSGEINLPNIRTIGEWAFKNNKIKKITIGPSLCKMEGYIFGEGAEPLEEIHFTGPCPPRYDGFTPVGIDDYILGYANLSSGFKIYVPSAYYQDYLDNAPEQWKGYLTAE